MLAGAGGAIGALARAGVAELIPRTSGEFPWATLIVNVVGCLAIGVAARRVSPLSDRWRFGVTGVIGGFTTFSAFADEVRDLLATDARLAALAYIVVTLVVGLVAVELGFRATGAIERRAR